MANYCTTKITLIGDNENLKKLYNKIDNRDFLNLESYPTLFENTENNSEFDWGSKWQNIDEIDFVEDFAQDMYIYGDSAWSPAKGLWRKISKEYNLEITLDYSEPGCNFGGTISFTNGEITHEEEMTFYEYLYKNDGDYFWDEVEMLLENESVEDVIEILGDLYTQMPDYDKEKLNSMGNAYEE